VIIILPIKKIKNKDMKALRIFSIAALSLGLAMTASAQTKTESFKVSGNCGMCKTKIEKAAKEAGARSADWNAEKQELTVTFKSSTTNTAKIQENIAKVGYDNAGAKATPEAYDKLHGCCKYDRTASATEASCCSGESKCTDGDKHHKGDKSTHSAKMDCCKDGKCTKEGHDGKDCCKADCCKDGKCSKEGHDGKDCCKKS
jgi:mercuric ion binding protein